MSELMSSMQLALYPTIALVFFALAFAGVMVRVMRKKAFGELSEASMIPFHDDEAEVVPTQGKSCCGGKGGCSNGTTHEDHEHAKPAGVRAGCCGGCRRGRVTPVGVTGGMEAGEEGK